MSDSGRREVRKRFKYGKQHQHPERKHIGLVGESVLRELFREAERKRIARIIVYINASLPLPHILMWYDSPKSMSCAM